MKRNDWILALLLIGVMLLCGCSALPSLSVSKGYCLITAEGTCLLICDETPIVLADRSKSGELFAGLQSGDIIRVTHDGIQESYPARTGAYAVSRLGSGSITEISQRVIDELYQLGWQIVGAAPSTLVLTERDFDAAVSWANYAEESSLYVTALNHAQMDQSSIRHLPIWKVSSSGELRAWKDAFGGILTLDQGYDTVASFDDMTASMDEAFFTEQSVLLIYIPSNSCSYRYIVNSVSLSGDQLCVHLQQANDPASVDCAMAGWLMSVTVPQRILEGITGFDAELNNLQD